MAVTTQEEILSGILPRVSIEKISLSNPSNNLEVNIELNIKEVLDNNFFGSWFDDINIKKYIIIDVIQSTDPQITEALSFSNDMIQLCNLSRAKRNKDDTRVKALSYLTGKRKLSELLRLLETKTTRNTISLLEDKRGNKNIKNYPSYTNSDGEKVYEISYKTKFTIANKIEPEHLTYFAVCSIDIQSLCSDLKIDYDVAESFEENGKVISEIVIEDSRIAGYSYIYVDANGVAWSGPVHQNDIGVWRSGDDENAQSITLSRITVSNTKIQDFRNFAEIEKMMLDFNQQTRGANGLMASSFNLENTLKQFTKIQSVDYKPDGSLSQFTDIFSSIDSNGDVKFLFGIDFMNVLKSCSKFSKLYDSNNETFKLESISNTKILDLKLYRRRIKNNISSNNSVAKSDLEKFNEEESDELIFQTKDESWKNFIDLNTQKASIRETGLLVSGDSQFMRYFTGVDKTFKQLTDGVYQYYIEFELEDGVVQLVKEQLQNLGLAKNQLIEYYNKVSKPTMRKFLLESQNPHIDSPKETSNNSVITDYGYDIVLNKLSPQLVNRLIREYGGTDSVSAPWVNCVTIFEVALDVFSQSIQTNDDRTNIINFLSKNLMPNSTNPSIISKMIELIDYFMSSISKTFDINLQNTNSSSPISPSSSKTNKSFKVIKFFNDIFDSNTLKSYNIDYLSVSPSEPNSDDGLRVIDKNKLTQRVTNEMSKFFSGEDLTINFLGEQENVSENIKYSFLTPTRLDFRNRSILFSGIENDNAVQNRTLENFYNTENQYEKAVSIYADILNFKLDVSGKNRQIISTAQQATTNLSELGIITTTATSRQESIKTSVKINNIFSDFANLTISRFSATNNATINSPRNVESLNNLMSSLSSGAIRSRQSNNPSYTSNSSHGMSSIISNTEIDYIKNLANKNPDAIKISNGVLGQPGRVSGFNGKKNFSASRLNKIPNQIRGLILKPQQLSDNVKNNIDYKGDFLTCIRNKTINYFNFEMIAEVQFLDGFERIPNTDNLNLNNPIWKTLDKQYIDSIVGETEILCRLKSFQNLDIKINPSNDLEKRYYDKYFIIKTTELTRQVPVVSAISLNPIIQNFIDSITRNLSGIRIRETTNIQTALTMIPGSIEIIRTDSTGIKQTTNIKDIKDIVAKDINKNVNIKVGKPITPATAFAATQALSLSVQESNISNKFRSSNHIPNTNIGRGMNSNTRQRTARIARN